MAGEPILIVDDNPVNLKLVRVLLTCESYDVRTAIDAEETLSVLKTFKPRLILMDLQLPGMDGLELTRRIKANPAMHDTVIVALTAYAMKGDEEKARNAGCDGYLSKPIDTRSLPALVARYLSSAPLGKTAAVPGQECGGGTLMAATILVVEDNPINRKMVRVTLETAGHRVLEAPDGRTALELVRQQIPTLILQDLLLPDISGLDLLQSIRQLPGGKEIPIIAFSGLLSKIEEARTIKAGFTDYLFKPVEPSRLVEMIEDYLPTACPTLTQGGQNRRILLVDDDAVQRKLNAIQLTEMGFQVIPASDAVEALDQARRLPPDAILCDLVMPRMNGLDFCGALRQDPLLAHIPVVLTSSTFLYVEESDRQMAKRVGANAFVPRTPRLKEVREALLANLHDRPPQPVAGIASLKQEYMDGLLRQLEHQAIHYASLSQRAASGTAQLAVLSGVAEILTQGNDLDTALHKALAITLSAGGVSSGALFLAEPNGQFCLQSHLGFPDSTTAQLTEFFGQVALLRRIAQRGLPVLVPSSEVAEQEARTLLAGAQAKSLAMIPLLVAGQQQGVLVLASTQHEIGEDWLDWARAVGTQLAQAVTLSRTLVKLTESEQKFRQMAENIRDVFWMSDPATTEILYVSPAYEEIWGRTCASLCEDPRSFLDSIHPDDRERTAESLAHQRAEGRFETEYRIVHADGSVRWIYDRGFPVRDESGRIYRVVGVAKDVTERKRAEEALRQSQAQLYQAQKMEAVGRLAGGVAHDFNNLLVVINGYSDLLLRGCGPEDPIGRSLQEIKNAGTRAAALTRQLLTFSRKEPYHPRPVDVNAVLENLSPMLRRLIGEDIRLVARFDPAVGQIHADPNQLEQVVMNLAVNARDAMPTGGTLTLATAPAKLGDEFARTHPACCPGPHVCLTVRDTGTGMDAATLPHIFEPFFTTKPEGQGTGLGLAIVYGIVKQSKGAIDVSSTPGQGTTFSIFLPCAQEEDTQQEKEETRTSASAPAGSRTVLLVEDQSEVRALVRQVLERDGCHVLEAASGQEALAVAGSHAGHIDLLVTDVVMPEMNGRELADRLTAVSPGLKVLYMSGYTDEVLGRHGMVDSNRMLIEKPFSLESLADRIRGLLQVDRYPQDDKIARTGANGDRSRCSQR